MEFNGVNYPVTEIGEYAFYKNSNLTLMLFKVLGNSNCVGLLIPATLSEVQPAKAHMPIKMVRSLVVTDFWKLLFPIV